MARIAVQESLGRRAAAQLGARPEEVGFFLAHYDEARRTFDLVEWRFIEEHEVESRSDYHVILTDEMRGELIRWAWDSGGVLVEAHSHGNRGFAEFSGSDIRGFEEWVPHVSWRLRGRPYAALVLAGTRVDALAWVDDPHAPEMVDEINLIDACKIKPTGSTIRRLAGGSNRGS